jgi:predicted nucleotide-binding protein
MFLSQTSIKSKWVMSELAQARGAFVDVIPVLIDKVEKAQLPPELRSMTFVDATNFSESALVSSTAREIARVADATKETTHDQKIVADFFRMLSSRSSTANALAAQSKEVVSASKDEAPNSVFVVHGHDDQMLEEVVTFIEGKGLKVVVLKDIGGASRSLMDKFFEVAGAAKFAIVLLSADDLGASRLQFDEVGVGERALRYRSRQNVILELGYFYGLLGWDSVFVIEKAPPKVFPDFERPSDLNGVIFDGYDALGKWKSLLTRRLRDHGFRIT